MNPKGLETDPPLAPEWLGSKSKDNPGGGGTGVVRHLVRLHSR